MLLRNYLESPMPIPIALTNAERQARYRAARKVGSTTDRRLNLYISADAWTKLHGVAKGSGFTKKEILEDLIVAEFDRVVRSMKQNSPEWNAFFNVDDDD